LGRRASTLEGRTGAEDRAPRQRAVDGGKGAIDEDIAVVRFGIANPHERPYRLDLAAAEEGGAYAEDGVAVAGDRAVGEIDRSAQIERIAGAFDIHVADYVLRAGDEQTFRLTEGVLVTEKLMNSMPVESYAEKAQRRFGPGWGGLNALLLL
jgi:hypothetical protein